MNINKYIPTYTLDSVFLLDPKDVKSRGFKIILSDLDNTLDSYLDKIPSDKVINKVNDFKNEGIEFIIMSNNYKHRVKRYADVLGVKYTYLLLKPLKFRLKYFLRKNKIDKDDCLLIGDQLFTDIALANKMNIKSLLVKPLTNKDQKFTTFRRKKETKLLKILNQKNKFMKWRT